MDIKNLVEFDKKDPKRIAIIGDALIDVWIHGKTYPSQDGCDKFVTEYRLSTEGGAANAANCLSDWKCLVDSYATGPSDIGIKARYLVDGKIIFREDTDILSPRGVIPDVSVYDAILLSDYDKGYLTPELIQKIIAKAEDLHIPIVADCKRQPDIYAGAIRKGNIDYYNRFGNLSIITRGLASPVVRGEPLEELPPVKCVNHVGAGDCFAAHLTLALAYGFSLEDAARVAHKAGWVYVQYPHNRPPRKEEIANV